MEQFNQGRLCEPSIIVIDMQQKDVLVTARGQV